MQSTTVVIFAGPLCFRRPMFQGSGCFRAADVSGQPSSSATAPRIKDSQDQHSEDQHSEDLLIKLFNNSELFKMSVLIQAPVSEDAEEMSEPFDPYLQWLGISPSEQPPHFYTLLGLAAFENDSQLIQTAAENRLNHLRAFLDGDYGQAAQALLNQVSRARNCLLNLSEKAAYDTQLQQQVAGTRQPPVAPPLPAEISSLKVGDRLQHFRKKKRSVQFWLVLGLVPVLGVVGWIVYLGDWKEGSKLTSPAELANRSAPDGIVEPDREGQETSPNEKKPVLNAKKEKEDFSDEKNKPENPHLTAGKSGTETVAEIGKESSPTEMENKDSPDQTIIIGQSVRKKTKEPISRVPIPPKERYESFVGVLAKEYGIQNELSKQSRFVLIEELLQYAVDERNPDRAYAIFSIVIEQLKLLRHCQSSAAFASSLSARFQIDVPSAKVKYLKLLTPVIDSQVSLVAYLNEVELVVQELESTESYLSAEELLKNVIQIGQSPMGRWMDLPYFSRLLNSFQLKKEIHQKMAELISRRKSGDLTPQDHRLLGAFHCFMDSDWDVGMEHYRQSNLKPIVAVAQKFADFNPSDLDAMVEMAELWFAASESMEKESSLFRARSLYWFGEYQKLASSEQIAKKTSKRIEELTQDFGLRGPLSDRSIPPALLLDRDHQEHLQSGTTAKSIRFLDSRHVGVLHEEGFRIFDVLGKRVVFDDFSYQYFDHPIVVTQDAGFAILKPREGLLTYQMGELQASGDFSRPSRRLQAKQPIRAADISTDGTVFALADQLIYRWRSEPSSNPQPTQQPDFTKSSAAFIPKRIRVIPGSSSLVLAGHRNLIRVSKSNTTSTLFSGKNIVDFDLAENGIGIAIAAEDRIFYRAFRGTRKSEWTVAWKPLAIRFLSNPRYMVTLHADHSICTWDVANSSDDQLVDRVQLDDFEAVDLAVQPGGEKLAVLGKDSRIRFLTLQVQ